jgi:large subunit ribosomal protein L24
MSAAKIKKGDKVVILSGKDKGKHGEVTKAFPKDSKVLVGGINMMTRHKKPSQADPQGGLERIEAPMHVSKVAIEDPKTGKATRVGFKVLEDGRKVRVAKRSGEQIDG